MRRVILLVVFILCIALVITGCDKTDIVEYDISFFYSDKSLEDECLVTRSFISNIENVYVKSFTEDNLTDYTLKVNDEIKNGAEIIVSLDDSYENQTSKLSEDNKNILFFQQSFSDFSENVRSFEAREYQAYYLMGIIAGSITYNENIAFIASAPSSQTIRGINAFTIGVKQSNPKAFVNVVWTKNEDDEFAGRVAFSKTINTNSDIIMFDNPYIEAINSAIISGKYVLCAFDYVEIENKNKFLCNAKISFSKYQQSTFPLILDEGFTPSFDWVGFDYEAIKLENISKAVTEDTQAIVSQRIKDMSDNTWDVFMGPLINQAGKTMLIQGQELSDEELRNMLWFVDGIIGTIPAT